VYRKESVVYIVAGVRTLIEGNSTHDRLCTCNLQLGYYSIEGLHENPDLCVYKSCSNGSVLAFNGTWYAMVVIKHSYTTRGMVSSRTSIPQLNTCCHSHYDCHGIIIILHFCQSWLPTSPLAFIRSTCWLVLSAFSFPHNSKDVNVFCFCLQSPSDVILFQRLVADCWYIDSDSEDSVILRISMQFCLWACLTVFPFSVLIDADGWTTEMASSL